MLVLSTTAAPGPVAILALAVLVTSVVSSLVASYLTHARVQAQVREYEDKLRARDESLGDHLKIACNIVSGHRLELNKSEELPLDKALSHLVYVINMLTGDSPNLTTPITSNRPTQG